MIYSLKGNVIHMETGAIVVECGGVGFRCQTTQNTQRDVQINAPVFLYTHLNVREDAMELFGFSSDLELNLFKSLTSVSGVGPKAALAILSVLTPEQVSASIASGDTKSITRAPGVGSKLAQRIILELKDKVGSVASGGKTGNQTETLPLGLAADNAAKAMEALMVLGYTPAEVLPVLSGLDSAMMVEQLIGQVLKRM